MLLEALHSQVTSLSPQPPLLANLSVKSAFGQKEEKQASHCRACGQLCSLSDIHPRGRWTKDERASPGSVSTLRLEPNRSFLERALFLRPPADQGLRRPCQTSGKHFPFKALPSLAVRGVPLTTPQPRPGCAMVAVPSLPGPPSAPSPAVSSLAAPWLESLQSRADPKRPFPSRNLGRGFNISCGTRQFL